MRYGTILVGDRVRTLARRAARLAALLAVAVLVAAPTGAESRRIVAVGDVHGTPDGFLDILRAAEMVDEDGHWSGGESVLVQTGDLMDRGGRVRETLDVVRRLQTEAEAAGGQVVATLGNHEANNLIGLFDEHSTPLETWATISSAFVTDESESVRKKAYRRWTGWKRSFPACAAAASATKDDWMAAHPLGFVEYQEAIGPGGSYGQWLRERPVVARVGGTIFLHGGLSHELVDMELESLEEINAAARDELLQYDADRETLMREGVVLPFSTLADTYCALDARLAELAPRRSDPRVKRSLEKLSAIRERLPNANRWMLFDGRGPLWFRGYARWPDDDSAEGPLTTIFETFGGERVVVGHTPQPGKIRERFDGRVYLIDTAMAYAAEGQGRPAALEIVGDRVSAVYLDGRVVFREGTEAISDAAPPGPATAPVAEPAGEPRGDGESAVEAGVPPAAEATRTGSVAAHSVATPETPSADCPRSWAAPDEGRLPFCSDAEVLEFLREAEIVAARDIGTGVTKPKKLTLERDGVRAHAVFHDVNVVEERKRLANGEVIMYFRDAYENNVAAYELSRLLGLDYIPPAALRHLDGKKGSVQLWIEKTVSETERREAGGDNEPVTLLARRRISDMWVFDNLINNIDRNQGNMLFDESGGFWLIDHTRAFSRSRSLPGPDRIRRVSRRLLNRIRNLDRDLVTKRLGPYLGEFEIAALFKRREKVLTLIDKRLRDIGEEAVLFDYTDPDTAVTVTYN